jgi:hypothetical protein
MNINMNENQKLKQKKVNLHGKYFPFEMWFVNLQKKDAINGNKALHWNLWRTIMIGSIPERRLSRELYEYFLIAST